MKLDPIAMVFMISLHYFVGNVLTSLLYRIRFGKNPNVPAQKINQKSRHMVLTKAGALLFLLWLASFCLGVFKNPLQDFVLFRPLFTVDPLWGFLISSACLLGMCLAQYLMGESFRIGQDEEEKEGKMSQSPLLKYSRNPIYVFSYSFFIGATLWCPSILTIFFFLALGLSIHLLVLEEEKFLKERLGPSYLTYLNSVPRYFLFF